MHNGFLKFCSSLLIVLLGSIGIDFCFGIIVDSMLPRTGNKGDLCLTNLGINEVQDSIIIVGSSRASHHYNSIIIHSNLGKETYNVGIDGCFFTHNCCIINSILERYQPELIIWEFDPYYLTSMYEDRDNVTSLYPYYGKRNYITKTLDEVLPSSEIIKLKSNIYRYNSMLLRIVTRFLQNDDSPDYYRGYEPSEPKVLKEPLLLANGHVDNYSMDKANIERFKKTIVAAKKLGTKIVLINSPKYVLPASSDSLINDSISDICYEVDVPYYDLSQLYINNPSYFNDVVHLNSNGADLYTEYIVSLLQHEM